MKKFARLLSMVLAVATVLSLCIGAFDYVDAGEITKGKENAINAVYDWGIMQGNDKGEFNPKANLTRDEMSKIIFAMKRVGLDVPTYFGGFAETFADAAKVPAWSRGYVGYAFVNNIFKGNEKNEINALGNLSYVEATIVLLRAMGVTHSNEDENGKTIDRYTGANWMINAIVDGEAYGLFKGLDIANFSAAITREDVAVMIKNAVDYFKGEYKGVFELAEAKGGVVTGLKDGKKFVLSDGSEYEIGDLKVEDFMGKKVSFCVEDKKVVSAITTDATVVNTTVGAIAQKKIEEDNCWTVDGKKLAKVEDVKDFYLFKNNTKKANSKVYNATEAKTMLDAEDDFQNITLINNGDSISVIYNPIYFVKNGDYTIVKEVVNKKYTGKYYVKELSSEDAKVYYWESKLDANKYYAFSIDGTELTQEGIAKTIKLADVKIKNGKFVYNGEELTLHNVTGIGEDVTEDDMFKAMTSSDYDKWNLIVYNNLVLGCERIDTTLAHDVADYAYVLDVNYEVAGGKTVYTVKAYVNNELKEFEVKSEGGVVPTKGHIYVYKVLDVKTEKLEKGDVMLTDKGVLNLTAYGEGKDVVKADTYTGKTVFMYDFNTSELMDASKFTVSEGVAKYGDEEYEASAFGYQIVDNDYVFIGFYKLAD